MGLCKCEKKKVTTLFCFEHRVNVCEFCMVASHQRCVVKPYLGWLKDSDFDPSCAICKMRFDADESKECVRLVCLDVFHWDCLHDLISVAPPTTAPSGLLCPSCEHPIIPQRNHGGPVAEALRSFLNRTEWVSKNLSDFYQPSNTRILPTHGPNSSFSHQPETENTDRLLDPRLDVAARQFLTGQDVGPNDVHQSGNPFPTPHTNAVTPSGFDPVYPVTEPTVHSTVPWSQRREVINSIPIAQNSQQSHGFVPYISDDEDKYKRRVALAGLARLFSVRLSHYFKPSHLRRPRTIITLLIVLLVLVVLVQHVHQSNFSDTRGDPLLDPHMNPNIHLDEHAAAAIHGGVKLQRDFNG